MSQLMYSMEEHPGIYKKFIFHFLIKFNRNANIFLFRFYFNMFNKII